MIMTTDENSKQFDSNKKPRKRSVFDLEQIRHLEHIFEQITHYPDLSLRQHLTLITQLPDKKIQIWFQNRRAKWRKQHQLGHFGGLHELTIDGHQGFVPAPKSNFVLISPPTAVPPHPTVQQLEQFFYFAFQTALAKSNENFEQTLRSKRYDTNYPTWFLNQFLTSTNSNPLVHR